MYASSSEVTDFVKKIAIPRIALRGCELYWENSYDPVYSVVSSCLLSTRRRPTEFEAVTAMETLLLDWNRMLYRSNKKRDQLHKGLKSAYAACKEDIFRLRHLRLGNQSVNNNKRVIKQLYATFYYQTSIDWIGAAKALHIMLPELYVPWDNKISDAYHRIHDDYRRADDSDSRYIDCYLKFLEDCEGIADELRRRGISSLRRNHPAAKYGLKPTLPKIIDECNWMRFSGRPNWLP